MTLPTGPLSLPHNPMTAFLEWTHHAVVTGQPEPTAMTLATVDAQGKPRSRTVLFKGEGRGLLQFFTNYDSAKGVELAAFPFAALVFWWPGLFRQIRVEGRVEKLTEQESDDYFKTRPRGSQVGAWGSPQSQPIKERHELEQRYLETVKKFEGHEIFRPSNWGGYGLAPTMFEFWESREHRLHERHVFTREDKVWTRKQLAP